MIASSPRVDDDARARGRLRIGNNLAIPRLPRAAFAPQLADRLDVQRPTLHVGVGKVASVGVGGKPSTDLEGAPFDERSAFAAPTEAKAFQAKENRRTEIVVAHQSVDIRDADIGHCERIPRRRRDLLVPKVELEVFYRSGGIGLPSAESADISGGLATYPN